MKLPRILRQKFTYCNDRTGNEIGLSIGITTVCLISFLSPASTEYHLFTFDLDVFQQGKCKFGDACTFSHDGRIPICTFFEQKGSCRYGNSCKFLHNSPGAGSAESSAGKAREGESVGALGSTVSTPAASGAGAATTASNQAVATPDAGECCGICLENIPAAGKRFGLLNCDHVFCVGKRGFIPPLLFIFTAFFAS